MGNHPEIGTYQVCRDRRIDLADILAILSQIYTLFGAPFTGLNSVTNIRNGFWFGNGYFDNGQTLFLDGIMMDIMVDYDEKW